MGRLKAAGKQKLSPLYGLDKLCLRGIAGVETQDAGGEDNCILARVSITLCKYAVQLAGVDEK